MTSRMAIHTIRHNDCPPHAPIANAIRTYCRNHPEAREALGDDPLRAGVDWLSQPHAKPRNGSAPVTRLMRALWEENAELQRLFPDMTDGDANNMAYWFVNGGAQEAGVQESFIAPVRDSLAAVRARYAGAPGTTHKMKLRLAPLGRMLPRPVKRLIKRLVRRSVADIPPRDTAVPLLHGRMTSMEGMNIIGYIEAETGLGESSRSCARAADAAKIPYSLCNVPLPPEIACNDRTWSASISNCNPYPVSVFHINANQTRAAFAWLGRKFLRGHYRIGYWAWELAELPADWVKSLDSVDEVWTPSTFVQKTIAAKSPVPVMRMPHSIEITAPSAAKRRDFGLPDGKFIFLTAYDMHSMQERKNPQAVIEAFRAAFPDQKNVALVIKTMHAAKGDAEFAELKNRVDGAPGIMLMNLALSRGQVYGLQSVCDCFVSLHRAEGFGLALAECMYLRKPVIATNWSGNTDFMSSENSCPVKYELVQLKQSVGPYEKGRTWAEPDIEHAAWYMRKVAEDADFRSAIGEAARRKITAEYSPLHVGEMYRRRLTEIYRGTGHQT
jgi:glycosyltransferase involved in cell wall biosynthesis